ncbi:MAG: hypothetical protein L3V56_11835 [Candidatus Magnetoovum sp. WYHC-5]|nr:hypothetical protein [Candidatus Magnetoovum sp. WYHC-5]
MWKDILVQVFVSVIAGIVSTIVLKRRGWVWLCNILRRFIGLIVGLIERTNIDILRRVIVGVRKYRYIMTGILITPIVFIYIFNLSPYDIEGGAINWCSLGTYGNVRIAGKLVRSFSGVSISPQDVVQDVMLVLNRYDSESANNVGGGWIAEKTVNMQLHGKGDLVFQSMLSSIKDRNIYEVIFAYKYNTLFFGEKFYAKNFTLPLPPSKCMDLGVPNDILALNNVPPQTGDALKTMFKEADDRCSAGLYQSGAQMYNDAFKQLLGQNIAIDQSLQKILELAQNDPQGACTLYREYYGRHSRQNQ